MRKAAVNQKYCVGCGCCAQICPLKAVSIFKGVYAVINKEKCVGCGKCQNICPASVIEIEVL